MGELAVLVEDPPGGPAGWAAAVGALGLSGVVDIVPAARTVLVSCATADDLAAVRPRLADVHTAGGGPVDPGAVAPAVTIAVRYDGLDLAEVADRCGTTVAGVVELHAGGDYRVAFCGFAPGFAYLDGLPPELALPRRATPRPRVPTGAVAIAAGYAAVYPRDSPGGWHLLGHTDAVLWDVDRARPALLTPGTAVRFVAR